MEQADRGLDATLSLVIDVLREALVNLNEDRLRCEEEEEELRQEQTQKAKKKEKKRQKQKQRASVSDAETEARKLNAHVSRLHRELSEQAAIAARERETREKMEERVASLIAEMRDMRAAQKHDLAEARARIELLESEKLEEKKGPIAIETKTICEQIYEVAGRTTAAIAAMNAREMSRDDVRAMRTAMDVHCTASVLDPHGMLCGLMHITCPLTAMREWLKSADSIDAMAVCLIRSDPMSEKARGAFTAALLRRATSTELGRAVIDRGPGKHGPVRVVTDAARRCPLAAKPEEMLAWLVRARARAALDLATQ